MSNLLGLPALSSFASDIDSLVLLILVLVGFWFILAEAIFFGLIIKFKAKDGQRAMHITGEEKEYKRFISLAHNLVLLCDVFIVVGSIKVWTDVKIDLPAADHEIRVIGQQWSWTFQHPGADNKLDTADDIFRIDELHVEVDKVYHFKLTSKDVLHSFSVPVFRLKQDAIPGRTITGWFEATGTGEHDIQCAEMCGIGHGIMGARIFIEDAATHSAWIAQNNSFAALRAE